MSEAVVIEITHRQIAQMLCNFNTLVRTGMIAGFSLEHRGFQVDEKLTEYRCSENCDSSPDVFVCHMSVQNAHDDHADRRDTQCRKDRFDRTEPDRQIQLFSVFCIAEIKESF